MNQGCRLGVSGAISWCFEQEEEGIILEADIVVHPDFSPYCADLLERYRQDTRVWAISGDNFQDGQWRGSGSDYFRHLPHCWGWASWRRAWRPQPPIPQCGGATLLGEYLGAAGPPQPAEHLGLSVELHGDGQQRL
ncbi:hypothetical protein [Cyanobium sp. Cruz-8H5]|uniref:hypothetical protein n=1 Tax=Cyanobium sp. Cruz-8H5 TaxID=2823712 RepID=UPI0020CEE09D|nr:hypothetical protein [Cyanobium sp. Cruz-8H5]MCP9858185.1 hypothetical protein [Cyanobium sp. Cruz-8H5]MCP9868304.1 hypothetical protein [Cyanobium sp. Cruz-8D1]